ACKLQLEGIVSKLASSVYRSGRDTAWQKVKCRLRQEFVVGGWRQSDAAGRTLSSLLGGYYDAGQLIFAGKLGTGFPQGVERDLWARLAKLGRVSKPPFVAVREYLKGAIWVRPALVVEGEFTTCTAITSCARRRSRGCGKTSRRGPWYWRNLPADLCRWPRRS